MKKFKEYALLAQAVAVYALSIMFSLILIPIFSKFYVIMYKPVLIGAFLNAQGFEIKLGGFIMAYLFLLPFFSFWLIKKKQWLTWLIGAFFPLLLSLDIGGRYMFWALVLTAIGWLLAQVVLLIKKKSK